MSQFIECGLTVIVAFILNPLPPFLEEPQIEFRSERIAQPESQCLERTPIQRHLFRDYGCHGSFLSFGELTKTVCPLFRVTEYKLERHSHWFSIEFNRGNKRSLARCYAWQA
jgi:hypothetical protein